ncbi:MAG: three-Cys-motif partner protein TcmP [Acidobacteria bacterium]|nr:three-Cys-motif partner protein TcmP [Acidobacteriota bacterium]
MRHRKRYPPPTRRSISQIGIDQFSGDWTEEKYRLIRGYFEQFATGTKTRWPSRTFVDLYSGAGYSRIRESGKTLLGSPLLAISVRDPFDKYIFCEQDARCYDALRERVERDYPSRNVSMIRGDCNEKIDLILSAIPSRNNLTLCFVDPFNLSLRFDVLRKLAERKIDLLCLLALHMDANRAYDIYLANESSKIDHFMGNSSWRTEWGEFLNQTNKRSDFPIFFSWLFCEENGYPRISASTRTFNAPDQNG